MSLAQQKLASNFVTTQAQNEMKRMQSTVDFAAELFSTEKGMHCTQKTSLAELACLLVAPLLVNVLFVHGTDSSCQAPD